MPGWLCSQDLAGFNIDYSTVVFMAIGLNDIVLHAGTPGRPGGLVRQTTGMLGLKKRDKLRLGWLLSEDRPEAECIGGAVGLDDNVAGLGELLLRELGEGVGQTHGEYIQAG